MKIFVSKELEQIKEELFNKGYEIIDESCESPCDAIICNLKRGGLTKLNMQSNIKNEGTLIIDLGSKSVEELEYILNNRVYSSIF